MPIAPNARTATHRPDANCIRNLVGGPGFEPGASRSRIRRHSVQTCRFLRFSVRFFKSTRPERPDLHESSAGLLHELLHGLSTDVDGATLRCPPASGGAACVHTAARSRNASSPGFAEILMEAGCSSSPVSRTPIFS